MEVSVASILPVPRDLRSASSQGRESNSEEEEEVRERCVEKHAISGRWAREMDGTSKRYEREVLEVQLMSDNNCTFSQTGLTPHTLPCAENRCSVSHLVQSRVRSNEGCSCMSFKTRSPSDGQSDCIDMIAHNSPQSLVWYQEGQFETAEVDLIDERCNIL
ncbi:hypothetical protein BDR05DRAFT_951508 [Suillus weaverae]|nr:hypothetical protein BDR05DRAFT_951508 [Suillus weaverae]